MDGAVIFGVLCGGAFGVLATVLICGFKIRDLEAYHKCALCRNHLARICTTCVNESAAQQQPRSRDGRFVKKGGVECL